MAINFTGTDEPASPVQTDKVCRFDLTQVDWNVVQTPDPITYTSLSNEIRDPFNSGNRSARVLKGLSNNEFLLSNGGAFNIDPGPLADFIRDASNTGDSVTEGLNKVSPHFAGDLKTAGTRFYTDGVNFNSVVGGLLDSNTFADMDSKINSRVNGFMSEYGILDGDKWNFNIGLNHIPEDKTVEFESTFYYRQFLAKEELWKSGDGWIPLCVGVQTHFFTKGYMTIDLSDGAITGGVGSGLNAGAFLEFLDTNGEASGWRATISTDTGVSTDSGAYSVGDITWGIGFNWGF